MATEVQHFKLNNLPSNPKADSIYYINKGNNQVEIFVTSSTGQPKSLYAGSQLLLNYLLEREGNDLLLDRNGQEVSRIPIPAFELTEAEVERLINLTNTSDLTNDGEDGINPFITAQDFQELSNYVNTELSTETIGAFVEGEPITPPEGLTDTQFKDKLFSNITLPIVTFNVTNDTIEKGETYNKNITITFTQNDAGALIEYLLEIDGTPVAVTDPQPTVFTNSGLDNITLQAFASHALSASLQANTISTSLITITRRLKIWYDAVAVLPTDSAEVRALGNDVFDNANTVTLNTGTTNNKFTIAVPTSVNNSASLSAQDITNNVSYTYDFIEAFNVSLPNGAGTEEYRIYALQVDNPFPSNAQHVITI